MDLAPMIKAAIVEVCGLDPADVPTTLASTRSGSIRSRRRGHRRPRDEARPRVPARPASPPRYRADDRRGGVELERRWPSRRPGERYRARAAARRSATGSRRRSPPPSARHRRRSPATTTCRTTSSRSGSAPSSCTPAPSGTWMTGDDTLERAQHRKLDHFADRPGRGRRPSARRRLRLGRAAQPLRRTPRRRRRRRADAQPGAGCGRRSPRGARCRLSARSAGPTTSRPTPYDAIACIEATEHFARDGLDADAKVAVYRGLLRRAALVAPARRAARPAADLPRQRRPRRRAGRAAAVTELIRSSIFPESMSASLRSWCSAGRRTSGSSPSSSTPTLRPDVPGLGPRPAGRRATAAEALVGAGGLPHLRPVLRRQPGSVPAPRAVAVPDRALAPSGPKRWAVPPVRREPTLAADPRDGGVSGRRRASAPAVRATTTSRTTSTRSGSARRCCTRRARWTERRPTDSAAQAAKVDFFADRLGVAGGAGVLDVGCGWGGAAAAGWSSTTASPRASASPSAPPSSPGSATVRCRGPRCGSESWEDHDPTEPYDAIVSFGAFEHFARDGSSGDERIARLPGLLRRAASAGCRPAAGSAWRPSPTTTPPTPPRRSGGARSATSCSGSTRSRSAPSVRARARVRALLPGPVLGPTAATSPARSTAGCRRSRPRAEAEALGRDGAVRRFRTYLAASEVQFRLRAITNYRVVLERRPGPCSGTSKPAALCAGHGDTRPTTATSFRVGRAK